MNVMVYSVKSNTDDTFSPFHRVLGDLLRYHVGN